MRSATARSPKSCKVGSRRASSLPAAPAQRGRALGAYAASRVTVRRALELLRDQGLVDSRQGFGWFVAADRVRQTLGQLGTIEAQLAEAGVVAERQILDFGFVSAPRTCVPCWASSRSCGCAA